MSGVKLTNIVKSYGSLKAVDNVSLDIKEGEFLTFLGPSGCGKTTTLRLISGFVQPTSGSIYFGDKDVTRVAPQHRQIGMVFQDYALFPHLTVFENIAFGLVERKYEKSAVKKRVNELLAMIELEQASNVIQVKYLVDKPKGLPLRVLSRTHQPFFLWMNHLAL